MPLRRTIKFVESKTPITEPVTKFGGLPVWMNEPQWPLSKSTDNPMRFIGQVGLGDEGEAKMAYIFMTDEEEVDKTWDPDAGENAVVIQPGAPPSVPTKALCDGPTLYRMVKKMSEMRLAPQPCEFSIVTTEANEPDYSPLSRRTEWPEEKQDEYIDALEGNKIGGAPLLFNDSELPSPDSWQLLLSLDSTEVPFYINFGDAGIGHVFLSKDGRAAKFLWQCA